MEHKAFDWLALSVTFGTVVGMLPAIAALMSIIWTATRLYEYFKGKKDGD